MVAVFLISNSVIGASRNLKDITTASSSNFETLNFLEVQHHLHRTEGEIVIVTRKR
jgi:hypothetical protein